MKTVAADAYGTMAAAGSNALKASVVRSKSLLE